MNISGTTTPRARTMHVIPDGDMTATTATAACGATVTPGRHELRPSHEVCKKCRRAMGWPFIVTWESHGQIITTDFH